MALAKFGDELFSDRFRLVSVLGDRRVAAWDMETAQPHETTFWNLPRNDRQVLELDLAERRRKRSRHGLSLIHI